MAKHKEKGTKSEEIAASYLASEGYRIRERNWRFYQKEADIIAEKDGKIIIVEVKSRDTGSEEDVSELFSLRKMKHMVDIAEAYVKKEDLFMEVRFDFFVVIHDPLGIKVKHIPDAFIPGVNW